MNDTTFHQLCDQYEAGWKAGQRPSLEAVLDTLSPDEQGPLLTELLQIELWWRRDETPPPSRASCQARFAGHAAAVEAAFEAFQQRTQRQPTAVDLATTIPGEHDQQPAADLATTLPKAKDAVGDAVPPPVDHFQTIAPEEHSQTRSAVESLCQAWESSVDNGTEPRVIEFIPGNISPDLRRIILRELLIADIQCRRKAKKELEPSVYVSQFPDEKPFVESALKGTSIDALRNRNQVTTAKRTGTLADFQHSDSGVQPSDITRYRPTKLHAKGGLGVVYRARDTELNRTVALKEIQLSYAMEPESQARFMFEAEVTGSLEHPGIVPIYGLGRYDDNRPYYAMRFIRGASFKDVIHKFHQQHPNPNASVFFSREFKSLLRRLIETCNAIHYAHEHGVLHRDIKPDNVMLGNYGETLVVDWGLAKLMSPGERSLPNDDAASALTLSSGSATNIGMAMGTPQYMSPEQAHGRHDTLTYASDVYSLGAVLLNIVTGDHPIPSEHPTEKRRLSAREIVLKVQNGETQKVAEITPQAPRALVSIIEKAMHLKASERYATAAELADDLERWLNDEVVAAHVGSESFAERAGRLIRRYRSWTLSTAAALIAIAIVAVIAALWINHAKQQERIAKLSAREFKQEAVERYRDSRQAISTWLAESDRTMQFLPGTRSIRRRMLEVAIEDYQKLAATSSRDPQLELERARALVQLGNLSQMLQEFERARDYYQQAIGLFASSVDNGLPPSVPLVESANAQVRIGLAYAGEEQLERAETAYRTAITKLESLRGADADRADRSVAAAYVNLAELNIRRGEDPQAIDHLTRAIKGYEGVVAARQDGQVALGLARAYEVRGRVHARRGEHEQAIEQSTRAANILRPLVESQPDHPDFLDALASAYVSRATSYRAQGAVKNEIEALEQAAEHFRALHLAMPDTPLYIENLALTLTDLGIALFEFELTQEAQQQLTEAQQLATHLADSYGQVPQYRVELATCQDALGQVRLAVDDDATAASQLLAAAVVAYDQLINQSPNQPEYFERLAVAQSHYAQALDRLDQHDAAVDAMRQAIKTLVEVNKVYPDRPSLENELAHVHANLGRSLHQHQADAEPAFDAAIEMWVSLCKRHPLPSYQAELAWLLATCPIESVRNYQQAIDYASAATAAAPLNPQFTTTLSLAHAMAGDAEQALPLIEQSKLLRGDLVGRDLITRGIAEFKAGDRLKALASISAAKRWIAEHAPQDRNNRQLLNLATAMIELSDED